MQVNLPTRLHLTSFDDIYRRLHRTEPDEPLILSMAGLKFAEPAGLLPLTCVLLNHIKKGGTVTIQSYPPDVSVCGYLERMNFYRLVKCPCPHTPGKRTDNDSFIEITEIDGNLPESVKNKLHSLFEARVDVSDATGKSFLAACGELVQNTRHAYNQAVEPQAADWPPALILAQYYEPPVNSLHVVVADSGIGIRRSLGAKDPQDIFDSDKKAIERALILGMRGDGSGKGLGLAAIARFMARNKGRFSIRSGKCLSVQSPSRQHRKVLGWKGTVVSLEIKGASKIDISGIMEKMAGKGGSGR